MQTAYEMFLHELSEMLDAERKIGEALKEQAQECSFSELQKAFQTHQEQTKNQISRLEQCFEQLGEEPEQTECKGIRGLIDEHDVFKQEDPAPDLFDIFNVTAASKVEKYEITSYESLIRMAGLMSEKQTLKLLKRNLREEEQALKKMARFSRKLKPENLGIDESNEVEEISGRSYQTQSSGSRPSSRQRARRAA